MICRQNESEATSCWQPDSKMAIHDNFEAVSGEIENSLLIDEENEEKRAAFVSWIKKKRTQLKPWTEFFNSKSFSKPKDVSQAGRRIVKNLDTYQANYVIICLILSLYCMFVHFGIFIEY